MPKLMIWAIKCGQSTPNVRAISCTWPAPARLRQQNKTIHNRGFL